ncbi:putative ribonuclease H-like superfamily [Helianthus annuus]|nr:putative ribonuclease H-like superfamily [Helianthus annuus]
MFMYAGDFLGVEKKAGVIANYLIDAIETVGSSNVLQVVTDNAANCKKAGEEIEKVYKHIFWSPCCVHTLNLIFKDLGNEFYWLNDTYKKGKAIVKYFLNHTHALSIFRENSRLELLKVAKTRFASHYILLRRLLDCREALATTIVLNSWRDWMKSGDANARTEGANITETIKDEEFWESVENILAITKPIFLLIKFCDGEGLKMGEIYEKMDNMVGEIKDVMKDNKYAGYFEEINQIVLARWDKMSIPLHCLAHALNPRFYDKHYLQKLAPGDVKRKAPNLDVEVSDGVIEAFKKIGEDEEERSMLRAQFATFHMKKGIFFEERGTS